MKKISYIIIFFQLFSCTSLNNKQKNYLTPGIVVTNEQVLKIRELFNSNDHPSEQHSISISTRILKQEISEDSFYDIYSKQDTNNNVIAVDFKLSNKTTTSMIEMSGSLLSFHEKLRTDANEKYGIILWISEPFYREKIGDLNKNHRFELHLNVLELNTGRNLFNDIIYSTTCCIDGLAMIFNPFTNSVLISYNDLSRIDRRNLMYGFFEINKILKTKNFEPKESVLQDKSEKRSPKFVKNNSDIYLYHTSGDRWGFFEHTGKQQIGISKINTKNELTDYRIITDSHPINGKLLLMDDTLFYRLENSRTYNEMIIKKINVKDLYIKRDKFPH